MSRSNHHGCNPKCGVCHPQKKWKHQLNRFARMKISDQRRARNGREHDEWMDRNRVR